MTGFLHADDGVRLNYVALGNGPRPVIYLHWMGGETSTWESLWAGLDGTQFRHVALDCRGHGRSDPMPSTFTNERLALDVLQLADALGFQHFVVVGHSFGGKIALRLAAMAPARVAGLVLLGAVGPGIVPLGRDDVEPILRRAVESSFVRDCFRPWFSVWPRAELDQALDAFARTPNWALRAVCEIALWTDTTAETTGIAAPALIVAGEHDPVYGPTYQRSAILPRLPHARMATVDCGHGMHLERPTEIAAHIETFLNVLPVN